MTREVQGSILFAALVVSVAAHVAAMIYAKPKVMTHVDSSLTHRERTAPMQVIKAVSRPDPVKINEVADQDAKTSAPEVADESRPAAEPSAVPDAMPVAVSAAVTARQVPELPDATPVFDTAPVAVDSIVTARMPVMPVSSPAVPVIASASSVTGLAMPHTVEAPPALRSVPTVAGNPDSTVVPTRIGRASSPATASARTFVPAKEVYEKVDEQVIASEKAAVRELVNSEAAAEMPRVVSTVTTMERVGEWTYFRLRVSPRRSLGVVPKDLVLLLDASGSIAWDRIISIRSAARRLLRSATNTGDRFNLVAFRDRYQYAFRTWQDCNSDSFTRADAWLDKLAAHGRTDVFATIASVLTLPRDPSRPLIAMVVTDGEATSGVRETSEILERFTELNDGLVSVYMYGVKSSANRELIDVLTHGNRGESFVYEGRRWRAGEGIESMAERFRDPVLSDLRIVFSAATPAETYPRLLSNLYRNGTVELVGRVPSQTEKLSFSLKGLNGADAYEGFFTSAFSSAPRETGIAKDWATERNLSRRTGSL